MYICKVLKQILHISLAFILSAAISLETIGIYIVKDTCAPCGNSTLEIELVKDIAHAHVHNEEDCCSIDYAHENCCSTETEKKSCCSTTMICHTSEHQHHQVDFYLKHEPDFSQEPSTFSFSTPIIAVLASLLEVNSNSVETVFTDIYSSPPLPYASDGYQALLCTFLL